MTDRDFLEVNQSMKKLFNRIFYDFYNQPGLLISGFKETNLGRLCPWVSTEIMSDEVRFGYFLL